MTLTQYIQIALVIAILCSLIFVVMAKLAMGAPQSGCLYPHCSADKSHCLRGCKGRGFHEGDEHADDNNLGI